MRKNRPTMRVRIDSSAKSFVVASMLVPISSVAPSSSRVARREITSIDRVSRYNRPFPESAKRSRFLYAQEGRSCSMGPVEPGWKFDGLADFFSNFSHTCCTRACNERAFLRRWATRSLKRKDEWRRGGSARRCLKKSRQKLPTPSPVFSLAGAKVLSRRADSRAGQNFYAARGTIA